MADYKSAYKGSAIDTILGSVAGKADKSYVDTELAKKQATLVSGTNIKTINGQSIVGSGNIVVSGGGGGGGTTDYDALTNKPQIAGVTLSGNKSLADIGAAASDHNHNGVYQPAGSYATTSDLAGKANASHTHAQSDITGLETALAGKASASDLTDLAAKVGNESSGLVKAVADLQTDVSGVETELSNING